MSRNETRRARTSTPLQIRLSRVGHRPRSFHPRHHTHCLLLLVTHSRFSLRSTFSPSRPSLIPRIPFLLPTPRESLKSCQPTPQLRAPRKPRRSMSHTAYTDPPLVAPSLQYYVRFSPSQSNPPLSPVILATPATSPPLPALELRVGDLPWMFNTSPDAGLSPGNTNVTSRLSCLPYTTTSAQL